MSLQTSSVYCVKLQLGVGFGFSGARKFADWRFFPRFALPETTHPEDLSLRRRHSEIHSPSPFDCSLLRLRPSDIKAGCRCMATHESRRRCPRRRLLSCVAMQRQPAFMSLCLNLSRLQSNGDGLWISECLSISRITQKVAGGFWCNSSKGCGVWLAWMIRSWWWWYPDRVTLVLQLPWWSFSLSECFCWCCVSSTT